jgi:hypothetical protein
MSSADSGDFLLSPLDATPAGRRGYSIDTLFRIYEKFAQDAIASGPLPPHQRHLGAYVDNLYHSILAIKENPEIFRRTLAISDYILRRFQHSERVVPILATERELDARDNNQIFLLEDWIDIVVAIAEGKVGFTTDEDAPILALAEGYSLADIPGVRDNATLRNLLHTPDSSDRVADLNPIGSELPSVAPRVIEGVSLREPISPGTANRVVGSLPRPSPPPPNTVRGDVVAVEGIPLEHEVVVENPLRSGRGRRRLPPRRGKGCWFENATRTGKAKGQYS